MDSGLCRLEKTTMLELLKRILSGQNQFASGGLLLMIIGGVSVYLRAVPMRIWAWIEEQSTMSVTIKDDDAAFRWVKEWFLDQQFLKRIRRLDVDTTLRGERLVLIPAPGYHWFWRSGRPFRVGFYRNEETNTMRPQRRELLVFGTIGRQQSVLWAFVNDIVDCHRKHNAVTSYLYVYNDGWSYIEAYVPRLLESVVLKPGEKERLLQDIAKFKRSKERDRNLGVPYHRGYLFYGPPGTGKTSLVSAIAEKFAMSIYAINLVHFNDRSLVAAMNDVPQNSVILFEDIDCMKSGDARPKQTEAVSEAQSKTSAAKEDRNGVTLSGLLNALDGFSAPDNVLFVMTSNQIEALDPALLRLGRIDYRLYLGPATEEQKTELYRRFFPQTSMVEAQLFVDGHPEARTMAEFQGLLLGLEEAQNRGDIQVALEFDVEASESMVACIR
jgi:mitochondrial chaperone BCS1